MKQDITTVRKPKEGKNNQLEILIVANILSFQHGFLNMDNFSSGLSYEK